MEIFHRRVYEHEQGKAELVVSICSDKTAALLVKYTQKAM